MTGITRRGFIKGGAATAAAGVCVCGMGGCATLSGVGDTVQINAQSYVIQPNSELHIDLTLTPELAKVGGSVKILDPGLAEPLIVVKVGEAQFAAASIKCTHRGLKWNTSRGNSSLNVPVWEGVSLT